VSESFVYVIAPSPEGPCKIGFSADPHRRLRQLQTGYPARLTLYHFQPFCADRAPLMEKLIHKSIAFRRAKGEWFNVSVEDAISEVEFSLIRYGDEPNLRWCLEK
jgi:hypothetical protein